MARWVLHVTGVRMTCPSWHKPPPLPLAQGMIALAEGVPELRALTLHGCNIGDRSLYAIAAYCR